MLNNKEHYDLMEAFERQHSGGRMGREDKSLWQRGFIYKASVAHISLRGVECLNTEYKVANLQKVLRCS